MAHIIGTGDIFGEGMSENGYHFFKLLESVSIYWDPMLSESS